MGSIFRWDNRGIAAATVISATASDPAHPPAWLRLRQRASRWRSPIGWTFIAGFNGAIPFNRGGAKTATIAAGAYASGDDVAAAVVAALEVADATPVWACVYSSGTHKFTLSSDLAFTLLWASGASAAASCGRDLGFAAADTSSATSHTGDVASYQSRHALLFDLGSAASLDVAILLDHNVTAARVDGNASALVAAGAAGSLSAALAGDGTILLASFGAESYRYWRLLLDAVEVPDGYTETSVPFLGPSLALVYAPSVRDYDRGTVDHSRLIQADQGAAFSTVHQVSRAPSALYGSLPEADVVALEAAFVSGPIRTGVPFFWTRRSSVPAETWYVYRTGPFSARYIPTAPDPTWDVSLPLQELLR